MKLEDYQKAAPVVQRIEKLSELRQLLRAVDAFTLRDKSGAEVTVHTSGDLGPTVHQGIVEQVEMELDDAKEALAKL